VTATIKVFLRRSIVSLISKLILLVRIERVKIKKWKWALLITGLAIGLSGCSTVATAPTGFPKLLGVNGASVLGTGKTITDHVVSFTTGKNCSTVRKNTGHHYCEEDELAVPDNVFCYTTLGDVTCYDRPAPSRERKRIIGKNPAGASSVR